MHYVGRDELLHARWKSRRLLTVASLLSGVGETNCTQVSEKTASWFRSFEISMAKIDFVYNRKLRQTSKPTKNDEILQMGNRN